MKLLFFFFGLLIMLGCNNTDKREKSRSDADKTFEQTANKMLQGFLSWRPQAAVALGFHEYDGKIADLNKNSLRAEVDRLKDYDQKLAGIDTNSLSKKMFYDYRILRLAIRNELFNFEDFKVYNRNPMTYAGLLDVNLYVKRNYAPLEQRLEAIISVEKETPSIVAAGKENLDDSLPRPYVETAIAIAGGTIDFLKGDLPVALKVVKDDSLMSRFKTVNDSAISSLQGFVAWLQKEKLPKSNNK